MAYHNLEEELQARREQEEQHRAWAEELEAQRQKDRLARQRLVQRRTENSSLSEPDQNYKSASDLDQDYRSASDPENEGHRSASDPEREERQRQEFEAQQQQDRLKQQNSPTNRLKNVAKDQAKQYAKKVVKKAVWEVIWATSPYWGTALVFIAGFCFLIFIVVIVPVAVCKSSIGDAEGIKGKAGLAGAKAAFYAAGVCQALDGGGRSGGGGAGASFGPPPTGGDPNGVGCQDCVTLESISVPIKATNACASGFGPCQIERIVGQKLVQLTSLLSGWQVTEAWPPTVTHQNPCHNSAMCVDANFTNPSQATAPNITNFINQANAAGLRAVYEVQTSAQRDQLVAAGVPASNIQVVTAITGHHFSVYNR